MEIGNHIDSLKLLYNHIRERIQQVSASKRDQRVVVISVIAISVFIIFIIFQFFASGTERLTKKVDALNSDLVKIENLRMQLEESNRLISQLTGSFKSGDEALISVVEDILVNEQIDRGSFSIKDSNTSAPAIDDLYNEKSVDVELRKIPLNKIVDLLYKVQAGQSLLKVSNLRIRTRFDNPDLIDVNFRISSFEFKKVI
jgi:general secretion pathway protein M